MKRLVVLASVCALVAACSDDAPADADGDGEVSAAEMAAEVEKADIKPQAGEYSASSELVSIDIPGAPEGMADMMKGAMKSQDNKFCITQEQADKGFEEMAKESQQGDCTVKSFEVDGGDIDAVMSCSAAGQGEMSITLDGSGTATTMEMEVTMEGKLPQIGDAKMVMRTTQKRIGDCPA
ncbi:MAG: DUF3617 domain-containing protein [Marinomonas sp.]|uniref:DUF3617 domain-containing protein n=1 Tax=Parasphingorhabdus sp. TaxID=2709688 RepID=UPI003264DAED